MEATCPDSEFEGEALVTDSGGSRYAAGCTEMWSTLERGGYD
jgi:hypothetical protein